MEPTSSTAAGTTAVGGIAVSLTGHIFGMQLDAMLFGFMGGLIILDHLERQGWRSLLTSIVAAPIVAGVFAPLVAIAVAEYFPWVSKAGEAAVRLAVALSIGMFVQFVIPIAIFNLRKLGRAP